MPIDLAVLETYDGGDIQIKGNDLAIVRGIENQVYLAWFGGNVEQSTKSRTTEVISLDWWGNNLFFKDTPSIQFNSEFERAIRNTTLNSAGRESLEIAAKKDLSFLSEMGITYTLKLIIVGPDRVEIQVKLKLKPNQEQIIIVNLKKASDGDFWVPDFNDDFY